MDHELENAEEGRNTLASRKGFKAAGLNWRDFTVIFNTKN